MRGGRGGKPEWGAVSTLPLGWEGDKRRGPETIEGPMARKAGIDTFRWCGVLGRGLKRFPGVPQGFSWGRWPWLVGVNMACVGQVGR